MRRILLATIPVLALLATPALAAGDTSEGAAGTTNPPLAGGGGHTTGEGDAQAGLMSAEEVRAKLEAEGYTDVSNLRREGNTFRAEATKGGETVSLQFDRNTGKITPVE